MSSNESNPSAPQNPEKETKLFNDIHDVGVAVGIHIHHKAYLKLCNEFYRLLIRTQPPLNDRQTHEFLESIKDEFMNNSVPLVQIKDRTIGEVTRNVVRGISEVTGILLNPSRTIKAYKKGAPIFQREIPEHNNINLEKLYAAFLQRIDSNKEFLPPIPKELQKVGTWVKVNRLNDQGTEIVQITAPIDYNEGLQCRYADGLTWSMAEVRVSGWSKNDLGEYTIFYLSNDANARIQHSEELRLKVTSAPDKNHNT